MYTKIHNYTFIDGNNLYLSTRELGWKLSYRKFRAYLADKYSVQIAYYFIGYIEDNKYLYDNLRHDGFHLIFKEVSRDERDNVKGNIDADLVLQAMIDIEKYDQAVIVTSDGDFTSLVEYLLQRKKLRVVLATSRDNCSKLLSRAAGTRIDFLDSLRDKLEYKK